MDGPRHFPVVSALTHNGERTPTEGAAKQQQKQKQYKQQHQQKREGRTG